MSLLYLEPVCALLTEGLDVVDPKAEDDLIATGALDSLALVELLFQLEQRFGITLGLEDIDPELLRTPASIARLVDAKMSG